MKNNLQWHISRKSAGLHTNVFTSNSYYDHNWNDFVWYQLFINNRILAYRALYKDQ